MRIRAGVILLEKGSVVLIRRVKPGRTYYVVPGGGLIDGETSTQAAKREAKEELGLTVKLERLLAVVERVEGRRFTHVQLYYLARVLEGNFGSGVGEEYSRGASHGSYEPVWFPLSETYKQRVYPRALVDYLAKYGAPEETIHLLEPTDFPH
jgi:8-oxo-dGTP diphosphatase